jgi:ATP-dependent DNA helicase DinG
VDVPGEALSCLIIDKIPFTSPQDPLLNALQDPKAK